MCVCVCACVCECVCVCVCVGGWVDVWVGVSVCCLGVGRWVGNMWVWVCVV